MLILSKDASLLETLLTAMMDANGDKVELTLMLPCSLNHSAIQLMLPKILHQLSCPCA
jgi:hypothetical protein